MARYILPRRERSSPMSIRILLGTLVVTAVFVPSLYQPFLSSLYQHLLESSFYKFSGFETILTITSYILIEPLYTYKFGRNPNLRIDVRNRAREADKLRPRLPKMRRPHHRLGEILTYMTPLLLLDFVMVKKFAGVPINDIRRSGGYAPIELKIASKPPVLSGHSNSTSHAPEFMISQHFMLPTLHNFTLVSPLQLVRALPPVPPTSQRILLELISAFFIYDALFFAIHIAFHRIKPLARIHVPHHKHAEIHPQVTNRLSITERVSLVLLANFALNIIGSHVFTRTCFIPIFVYLLIEVHCGMDLDWGYEKILPNGFGAGAKVHAEHHKTGAGAYAPFFGWWDAGLAWIDSKYTPKIK